MTTHTPRSSRADGRGHWPRGRRQHADVRIAGLTWPTFRRRLVDYLAEAPYGTQADLTRSVGVPTKTVWRWLHDEDWPSPENAAAIEQWWDRMRRR